VKKGLLAIQYWPGDQEKAFRLAKLIADNEPKHCELADFLFVARFDASHDSKVVEYVSRKFDVRTMKTASRATGHPFGCWMLWFSLMEWVYHMKNARKIPDYSWVLTFEADTAPTRPDWLSVLNSEWERLSSYVVGAETFHWRHHINGNLMASCDLSFLKWLVLGVTSSGVAPQNAWDIDLFPQFVRWGAGFTPAIVNVCGKPSLSLKEFEDFRNSGAAFIHGVKNDDLYNLSREALLGKKSG
jgi:hypothetical protein